MPKRIIVVGAGPGGLASAMLLAQKGYSVDVYEAKAQVGGRNGRIELGAYAFDIGPTFFLYKPLLEEVFQRCGLKLQDYVELTPLDPLYQLVYDDQTRLYPSSNPTAMKAEIGRVFPGREAGYDRYLREEAKRFETIIEVLKMPFMSLSDYLKPKVIFGLRDLDPFRSLYDRLKLYFEDERLIYAMAFQAKYLGMSPWECPSAFTILSYMEHAFGLDHVQGGLNQLARAMAQAATELGARIHLNEPVNQLLVRNNRDIYGVELRQDLHEYADAVVLNGDFAGTITKLLAESARPTYSNAKLKKRAYSCSAFMLYLGLDRVYDHLSHHNIFFSEDYRSNVNDLTERKVLTPNASFYVHNPSRIDGSLAPKGHSSLYVLVPVPNTLAAIDWPTIKAAYRDQVLDWLETRAGLSDVRAHIQVEHIITPADWRDDFNVYEGAIFNMAHSFNQMMFFRPHNRFNSTKGLYLVGGGTHPGSGLPTIYQSAIISADLIERDLPLNS
jgi:phytoene desaturase